MKLANKQLRRSVQSWMSRAESRPSPIVDYNIELRTWLQHVISEAEKNHDFEKKDQFLNLLKDFNTI